MIATGSVDSFDRSDCAAKLLISRIRAPFTHLAQAIISLIVLEER